MAASFHLDLRAVLDSFPWAYCRPFVDPNVLDDQTRLSTQAVLAALEKLTRCKEEYEALTSENKNIVVLHTDPNYENIPPIDPEADVTVFLLGPTDHSAAVSHYRMETVLRVAGKVSRFFQACPFFRLVFVVPEYQHLPSEEFRDQLRDGSVIPNRSSRQLRWEMNYLNHPDIHAMYCDFRVTNPEVVNKESPFFKGNTDPTVLAAVGKAIAAICDGKTDGIAYTPKGSVGANWVKENLYRAFLNQGNPEIAEKIQDEETPVNLQGYYTEDVHEYMDGIAEKIREIMVARLFSSLGDAFREEEMGKFLGFLGSYGKLGGDLEAVASKLCNLEIPEESLKKLLDLRPPVELIEKIIERWVRHNDCLSASTVLRRLKLIDFRNTPISAQFLEYCLTIVNDQYAPLELQYGFESQEPQYLTDYREIKGWFNLALLSKKVPVLPEASLIRSSCRSRSS